MKADLAGRIAQYDRIGFGRSGHSGETDLVFPGFKVQRNVLSDDGEVLIVDRQRGIRCDGRDGKGGKGGEEWEAGDCFHVEEGIAGHVWQGLEEDQAGAIS